jgi:hypothetical protein
MCVFFFSVLGFELRGLQLEPLHQLFFVKGFLEIGSQKLFCPVDFESDPPDLSLLSS